MVPTNPGNETVVYTHSTASANPTFESKERATLSRRAAIAAAAAAILTPTISLSAPDTVLPTSASDATPKLTVSEQIMCATVRLSNETPGLKRWGTGFHFRLFNTNENSVPVIVTNQHVIDGWDKCSFSLASRASDGSPDLDHHVPIEIPDLKSKMVLHPSADLAIIPTGIHSKGASKYEQYTILYSIGPEPNPHRRRT